MSQREALLEAYRTSVRFPEVSGFETLDLLRLRSRLAAAEGDLTPAERALLEAADATFLSNAATFYRQVSQVASLETLRRSAGVPPSHWWWYLDSLVRVPASPA
jgi:hypothetical protein